MGETLESADVMLGKRVLAVLGKQPLRLGFGQAGGVHPRRLGRGFLAMDFLGMGFLRHRFFLRHVGLLVV